MRFFFSKFERSKSHELSYRPNIKYAKFGTSISSLNSCCFRALRLERQQIQDLIFKYIVRKIAFWPKKASIINYSMCRKFWTFMWTKVEKNLLFLERFIFSSSEKLTFEKENVIFLNTFFNFNLFYLIEVIFLEISFIWTFRTSGTELFIRSTKISFIVKCAPTCPHGKIYIYVTCMSKYIKYIWHLFDIHSNAVEIYSRAKSCTNIYRIDILFSWGAIRLNFLRVTDDRKIRTAVIII